MGRIECHASPNEADIARNTKLEPEGERIRRELVEFLERNKIAAIYLDTATLTVDVQSVCLPPKIRNVLSVWGSIYVVDESVDPADNWRPGDSEVPEGYEVVDGRLEWAQPERPAAWNDNVVPPLTHPLGRHWTQPAPWEAVIDDETATMSSEAFERLAEYSSTMPTGAYEGKMWKRHLGDGEWLLGWYGYSKIGKGYVSNNWRRIVLTDGEEAAHEW